MSLVRWQPKSVAPFQHVHQTETFENEVDRLFSWAFGRQPGLLVHQGFAPAMDVVEHDDHYLVRADLPGLTREEIEVTYQDGFLTLKGEKKSETEEQKGKSWHRERVVGKFHRSVRLGQKVDAEKISGTFKDGVLELKLPLTAEVQPRKIDIKQ